KLGERQVVARAVTNDARNARGGPVAPGAIDAGRRRQLPRRPKAHTRMVVVKNEGGGVRGGALAADAQGPGAQVTVAPVGGQRRPLMFDDFAVPRAVLPVRGDNDPLLAQRMPSFFPGHKFQLLFRRVLPSASYMNARGSGSEACAPRRSSNA